MGISLVIVESPAKAKTINKFLGKGFIVRASMGHVRDLPKRELGVDEETFEPTYTALPDKKKTLVDLRKEARKASAIYLAADPDREGEAICWHLQAELAKSTDAKFHRVLFNEITKRAILQAFEEPLEIDVDKVEAQQARRILDRLVGYKISPLLWDKVRRGLSAGRVQSVALRIICERERQILAFKSDEYWSLNAGLSADAPPPFRAKLLMKDGKKVEIDSHKGMGTVLGDLGWNVQEVTPVEDGPKDAVELKIERTADSTPFKVVSVQAREKKKHPLPPFITSKLQQDASRRLGFPVQKAMRVAQGLYEGREIGDRGTVGLITYMRTDSTRVSDEAIADVREFIHKQYGKEAAPEKPRAYKVAKQAQEAHEAIRPTSMELTPDVVKPFVGRDEWRLYTLIWNRFVASQMESAVFDVTRADIEAGSYTFRANGQVLKSSGFLAVYSEAKGEDEKKKEKEDGEGDESTDRRLPALVEGQELDLAELLPKQHFTQPPPRFSEATLVKELEENGIGRPSTYAQILSTIMDRSYVDKDGRRFRPTELGLLVNDLMVHSFGQLIDVGYTARMEEELDRIEEGDLNWIEALKEFSVSFEKDLETARVEMRNVKAEAIPTDHKCDKCGEMMVMKWGRFGHFLACSAYPECKNTRDLGDSTDAGADDRASMPAAAKAARALQEPNPIETEAEPCENCGQAMVLRRGRFGQFLACSGYPDCKTTRKIMVGKDGKAEAKADVLLDESCPRCDAKLAVKQGRFGEFTACSTYPKCRYVKMKETDIDCPECGKAKVVERRSKRGKLFYGCGAYPDCSFVTWKKPIDKACPDCESPFLVEKITKKHGRQLMCDAENCDYIETTEA
ncbi:MAG: type I DNA topoisomerase [Acidobacteriota bacterium]|nr:type I DNA topoisomerase [Acidobacteriota bacterium]